MLQLGWSQRDSSFERRLREEETFIWLSWGVATVWQRHVRTVLILSVVVALLGIVFWKPISVAWSLHEARGLLRERESERAAEVLLEAHQVAPDNPEVNYLLARTFRRLGKFKRVVEHLDVAEEFGWPAEMIRLEQLMGAAQAGQLNASAPELYKFLSRGGDYGDEGPEVCEALVNGYFLSYQFGLAQPLLDEWQRAYPDDAQCYMFRGLFYENRANPGKAVAEYRKAVLLSSHRLCSSCCCRCSTSKKTRSVRWATTRRWPVFLINLG